MVGEGGTTKEERDLSSSLRTLTSSVGHNVVDNTCYSSFTPLRTQVPLKEPHRYIRTLTKKDLKKNTMFHLETN